MTGHVQVACRISENGNQASIALRIRVEAQVSCHGIETLHAIMETSLEADLSVLYILNLNLDYNEHGIFKTLVTTGRC
jgi:hypothetical protein